MMATKNKKLSSHLLEMKFMKKSKEDREKLEEQEKYAQVFESDQVKEEDTGTLVTYQPNQALLENLLFPRRSYGGQNPVIEKLMEEHDGLVPTGYVSKEDATEGCDVTDKQMADHYTSLVETMGKKFQRKRQRSPSQSTPAAGRTPRTPSKPPRQKRAKEFWKPNEDGFV